MKKKYLILLIIILLIIISIIGIKLSTPSIERKEIITETINNSRQIICIHYPKTNIKNLDNKIKTYIKNIKKDFKNNYGDSDYLAERDELNIDYKYYIHDNRYISISLITYINSLYTNYMSNEAFCQLYILSKLSMLIMCIFANISTIQLIHHRCHNGCLNFLL